MYGELKTSEVDPKGEWIKGVLNGKNSKCWSEPFLLLNLLLFPWSHFPLWLKAGCDHSPAPGRSSLQPVGDPGDPPVDWKMRVLLAPGLLLRCLQQLECLLPFAQFYPGIPESHIQNWTRNPFISLQ